MNTKLDQLIIKENQNRLSVEERTTLDEMIASNDEMMTYYLETRQVISDDSLKNCDSIPEMSFDYSRLNDEKTKFIPLFFKVAAVLIVALSLSYFAFTDSSIIEINSYDQVKIVELADGSKITLNKNSQLSYSSDFNDLDRKVSLNGEAFFDIKKSPKAFIISAIGSQIEVLGTKFNVITSSKETKVDVESGKVKFSNSNNFVLLTQGNSALSTDKKIAIQSDDLHRYEIATWKSEQWTFRDEALGDVFKFLEKTYDVELIVENDDIPNMRIVASMSKESIENILQNIAELYDLEIRSSGSRYHIKRKM